MTDYSKVKVGDLRKQLVDNFGYTQEDAGAIKGKAELIDLVETLKNTNEDSLFDNVEIEEDETYVPSENEETQINAPDYNSSEWSDYVMGQFSNKELSDGSPNIQGLRRVAGLLLGPIVYSEPQTLVSNVQDTMGPGRAYATWRVEIYPWRVNSNELAVHDGLEKRIFGGAAGAFAGNVGDDQYAVFPEAMAGVRAEARALKRALNINTVSAEEKAGKDVSSVVRLADPESRVVSEWKESDLINSTQVTFIKKTCEKLSIDLDKFINCGEKQYENIEDINKTTAVAMIERLNQYQSANNKIEVPQELKLEK